jgi:transposase
MGNRIPLSRNGRWHSDGVRRQRSWNDSVERDPARICEILVGLPEVNVLGVDDGDPLLEIHVECRRSRPGCPECGVFAHLKDQRIVTLVDLPCFGKPTRLAWHKRRWRCPESDCPKASWTEEDDRIAQSRLAMTDRAGRWVTEQVVAALAA